VPVSAIDAISPAFQHTKQQLIQPFRAGQWARLALVGLLAGELHSGGCNGASFQMPARTSGTEHFLGLPFPAINPALYAGLIAVVVVVGLVLLLLFIYVNSVMRFVLFDSVVAKRCEIRRGWNRRQTPGLRYFGWQLLLLGVFIMGLTILAGIPLGFAFAVGWLKDPSQHLVPLILGGMLLFFLLLAFVIAQFLVQVVSKDFVVPQMALEDISAFEGWRRLWPMLVAEKGGYAGYIGMKIVTAIGAAVVLGIVATIIILALAIPLGGFGAIAVLLGKAAGLSWNLYTISVAVMAGTALVALIVYAIALISVPAIVFFPAYSIYFFAPRYPALYALLHPMPPPPAPPLAMGTVTGPEPIG